MEKIGAILFDIDGTLLNTTELIYQAFEHSLKTHGHKVLGRDLEPDFVIDNLSELLSLNLTLF